MECAFKVTFKCLNCAYDWTWGYPKGAVVGYGCMGIPFNKHAWICDNIETPKYNYSCQNCGHDDIEIIDRFPALKKE